MEIRHIFAGGNKMSNYYSNPTANAAIGAVDKEIARMRKWARDLKKRRRQGRLTPQELARARRAFTGIHRHLLRNIPKI